MSFPSNTKISELLDLRAKTAIVTGGAMGIGQAIAARLAEAGAYVVVIDIDPAAAEETVAQIRHHGGEATAEHLDVTDAAAVQATIDRIAMQRGHIDILVNNAGVFQRRAFLETDDALWSRTLDVNIMGVVRCTRAAAPHMLKSGHGSVVNIASVDAYQPGGALAHYDTSKAGVVMLTKSLAWEFGRKGIRVNAVVPGGIQTPGMAKYVIDAMSQADVSQFHAHAMAYSERILVGRLGEPDDVAKVVLFLVSPMASFVNGAMVNVEGGVLVS